MTFLASLILRRIAQYESNIPLPHSIKHFVESINRIIPVPTKSKETQESFLNKYTSLAHAINSVLFVLTLAKYLLVTIASFIF